ncbi:hypothetical protein CPB84DRAFT_1843831 [Gymnopilus junonius]|uniref:Uncharacterized protein n=1 Tax=Gymnopilus junonius TaxID=109634 RepID=A0A9P5NX80_GYMJU|nr:hypothetical protein CPB84DRAFT_1843831 [Gymnopilus junonius]
MSSSLFHLRYQLWSTLHHNPVDTKQDSRPVVLEHVLCQWSAKLQVPEYIEECHSQTIIPRFASALQFLVVCIQLGHTVVVPSPPNPADKYDQELDSHPVSQAESDALKKVEDDALKRGQPAVSDPTVLGNEPIISTPSGASPQHRKTKCQPTLPPTPMPSKLCSKPKQTSRAMEAGYVFPSNHAL